MDGQYGLYPCNILEAESSQLWGRDKTGNRNRVLLQEDRVVESTHVHNFSLIDIDCFSCLMNLHIHLLMLTTLFHSDQRHVIKPEIVHCGWTNG